MRELMIINASAGSGKTFNLTREFLKLVVKDTSYQYFRTILAVTFTNKATAEMKKRILDELHLLASGKESDHLEELVKVTGKGESEIRKKCFNILQYILHGYSWFKIETIDTFFQGVIRSFLRELGIPGHFTTEIDTAQLLDEAVDSFLDLLENDQQMLQWLMEHIETKIENEKNWSVKKELIQIGKDLFKEVYIENSKELEKELSDLTVINKYKNELILISRNFEKEITGIAAKAIHEIESLGLTNEDFHFKASGPQNFFYKIINKDYSEPNSRVTDALSDPKKWANKSGNRKAEVENLGENKLTPLANQIIEFIEKHQSKYYASKLVLKQIYLLGLITRISEQVKTIKQEKGIMLISDSAPFIHRIIDHNDTPFIYEKIGNRFHHLLIDEFQDTSKLQYQNFKPLISNSLSEGHKCLVVGDIKQSIYRWRNSNWEILAKNIKQDFDQAFTEINLDTNFRSCSDIIRFNNLFFREMINEFEPIIPQSKKDYIPLNELYKDAEQNIPAKKKPNEGWIHYVPFPKEECRQNKLYFGETLVRDINRLLEKDYQPGDIAVLVRSKKEGTLIAEFIVDADKKNLFSKSVGVISNESLLLNNSIAVKTLIAALKFTYDTDDKLAAAELLSSFINLKGESQEEVKFPPGILNPMCLDELIKPGFSEQCKAIRNEGLFLLVKRLVEMLNLNSVISETVYLDSFLDIVYQYSNSEINDIYGFLEYWNDEGSEKTISAAETSGAIRIQTIHRSKGLEYPAVIIPFTNWDIYPKTNSLLWIKPNSEPFNKIQVLPVSITGELSKSDFSEQYSEEEYHTLIDNLNVLYVALTRAANCLLIYSNTSGDKKNILGKLVENVFKKIDNQFNNSKEIEGFSFGEIPPVKKESNSANVLYLENSDSEFKIPDIRIKWQAEEFLRKKEQKDPRTLGKIFHSIMEDIKTSMDVDFALMKALHTGIIDKSELQDFKQILNDALSYSEAKNWFSNKYKILTEASILLPEGSTRRPDRILISEDSVIVIDYKFGQEEEESKHKKQVSNYMKLLSDMGYKSVQGFIWYVFEKDIVEVIS
ncbi:MAG: UvrD-helicase domain-containing protein [Bacteroidales bacterium]|nr:UvrD-helicase domain-containing protein [Bacteroidales bacterium]MBN2818817.1 UvrD-helicase domain-containing protein [Bacteroidales bacterium]